MVVLGGVGGALFELIADSTYATRQGDAREQPIPFSHAHHVGSMGIDCRYCHTSVDNSRLRRGAADQDLHELPFADLDQQLRRSSRCARATAPIESISWTKVYDLPDYVYFNHSIHVKKGVGCETCHGRVDNMPLMYQNASLQMRWCLDCHRNPGTVSCARAIRSRRWDTSPSEPQEVTRARGWCKEYNIQKLETCWTCHR